MKKKAHARAKPIAAVVRLEKYKRRLLAALTKAELEELKIEIDSVLLQPIPPE